jgi:hypothetical protein
MTEDFYNTKEYYQQPQEDRKEEQSEVRVGNKWLYQVSPEKNPKVEIEHDVSEQRGRSLSHSLDRRYDSHPHQHLQNASPEMTVQGDIIDYKTLLSRIERQVMMQEPVVAISSSPSPKPEAHRKSSSDAPSFSPPPRLSPQQTQFTVMQANSTSSSYITVAPVHSMQNNSIYSTNPKAAAALARASKSLARTDANLEEIVHEQRESAKKKQQQQTRMMQHRTSSSSVTSARDSKFNEMTSRSVVATRLMFPSSEEPKVSTRQATTIAISKTVSLLRSNSTARSTASANNNNNTIEAALKKSQQASRSKSPLHVPKFTNKSLLVSLTRTAKNLKRFSTKN